jgi:ATP-dependent DNA helicase PIF1
MTLIHSDTISIPENFDLNDDLRTAYDLMEKTSQSLFVTGRAGTGKSSLLNYFRKHTKKKFVVLAPTGLAALQVGGVTIHSFFGFRLRTMIPHDPDIRAWGKTHPRLKVLQKMDALIIDEVSMVRSDIMDAIDYSLRLNLGNDAPFGGKQLILIGDVFQLPPVEQANDIQNVENDEDASPYFFDSMAFRNLIPKVIELKKVYRQNEDDFLHLLNRIRTGSASDADLDELNQHTHQKNNNSLTVTLSAINAIADNINLKNLMTLKTTSSAFEAIVAGNFPEKIYPAPFHLRLKTGAQIMMVKNDLNGRWVNGSIGVVEYLDEDEIKVRFADGEVYTVEKVTWENKNYSWDKSTRAITAAVQGTFRQYPLRLAWAMTIHKSQGLTFDNIAVDLGKGAFAHGQLYVALSRCRTLGGIQLNSKIALKDIIVDERVERFARRCRIG